MTVIFPQHGAKYAVPGLGARVQSEVPRCMFDQLEAASAGQDSGPPAESCRAQLTAAQTNGTDSTTNTS